jgi:hypothetical protein
MRRYLDNDILPEFGNIPVNRITPKQCADLQQKIEEIIKLLNEALALARTSERPPHLR